METYTALGALILQNEMTLWKIMTGLGFLGWLVLMLFQVVWLDQDLLSGKDSSQTALAERERRGYQRITFPGLIQANLPAREVKFQGTIHNISRKGISIISPERIGRGSLITLGISFFGLAKELYETSLEGKVAYCLNGNHFSILGIVFKEAINETHPDLFRTISALEARYNPWSLRRV